MVKGAAINACKEEPAGPPRWADITFRRVAGENFRRGRVQRHYSALSELGLPDRQNAGIEIHIVSLKQEGLRKTQTG
ncbi:hypothetical protein GCM10023069_13720 [Shinella granuli]